MDRERPRWRFRIRTVMRLVAIAAPAAALVVEPRRRFAAEAEKMRAENKARLAAAEAHAVRVAAEHARRRLSRPRPSAARRSTTRRARVERRVRASAMRLPGMTTLSPIRRSRSVRPRAWSRRIAAL
jgi:hypothetical protein